MKREKPEKTGYNDSSKKIRWWQMKKAIDRFFKGKL